jgi:hypothetical protein
MAEERVVAEKILKIPLSELATIRLICKRQNCGGVAEIPVSRLVALVGQVTCPSCNQAFSVPVIGGPGGLGGLKALGKSLENLAPTADMMVEFVVPAPD